MWAPFTALRYKEIGLNISTRDTYFSQTNLLYKTLKINFNYDDV